MPKVMSYNGTTSKSDLGSYFDGTGDKSIIIWLSMKKDKTAFADTAIVTNGKLYISYSKNGNVFQISSNNSTFVSSAVGKYINTPFINIIMTRTSTGIANIYINGILSGTANQNSGTPVAGTTNLFIGSDGNRFFNGLIGSVRIIDGILTPAEMSNLYSSERGIYGI